jgi:hypothetical protein
LDIVVYARWRREAAILILGIFPIIIGNGPALEKQQSSRRRIPRSREDTDGVSGY